MKKQKEKIPPLAPPKANNKRTMPDVNEICGEDYIDVDGVLCRMQKATGVKSFKKLGEVLGVTSQAIGNSKARKSISLALLTLCTAQTGVSLDYLVFGKESEVVTPSLVVRKGVVKAPISLHQGWIENSLNIPSCNLRSHLSGNRIYLVDTSDNHHKINSSGNYLMMVGGQTEIRQCSVSVSGKDVSIQGEPKPFTPAEAQSLKIIGKVVWEGRPTEA